MMALIAQKPRGALRFRSDSVTCATMMRSGAVDISVHHVDKMTFDAIVRMSGEKIDRSGSTQWVVVDRVTFFNEVSP